MKIGREDVVLDPLAVQQYVLLVGARAEVRGLTRVREQELMLADVAVDVLKAVVRAAAKGGYTGRVA